MRAIRFILHCINLRSFTLARWVDAYENFTPTHGK
jgi:hypothetical protein